MQRCRIIIAPVINMEVFPAARSIVAAPRRTASSADGPGAAAVLLQRGHGGDAPQPAAPPRRRVLGARLGGGRAHRREGRVLRAEGELGAHGGEAAPVGRRGRGEVCEGGVASPARRLQLGEVEGPAAGPGALHVHLGRRRARARREPLLVGRACRRVARGIAGRELGGLLEDGQQDGQQVSAEALLVRLGLRVGARAAGRVLRARRGEVGAAVAGGAGLLLILLLLVLLVLLMLGLEVARVLLAVREHRYRVRGGRHALPLREGPRDHRAIFGERERAHLEVLERLVVGAVLAAQTSDGGELRRAVAVRDAPLGGELKRRLDGHAQLRLQLDGSEEELGAPGQLARGALEVSRG
mmetsp:Transcript_16619/g.39723  ORF Transcript_16619/g.39723 Transcript_16619/m.39723 type:complete len:355 (-) Transcript_16619:768-1832(-)